jgi:hypothetical protein
MTLRSTIFPLLIAAPLLIPSASASSVACVSGTTGEGFPDVTCSDGTYRYQDMDGTQTDPASVGYRAPGTWVVVE